MALAEVGENFAVGVEAQDSPVAESGDKLFVAHDPEGTALVPYYGTHELGGATDQEVTIALKINCGMLRDEANYFRIGLEAVRAAGLERNVAVFALGPRTDADIFSENSIPGLPDDPKLRQQFAYWTTRGPIVQNWKNGDNAISPVPISWYGVHDQFEDEICSSYQFPNLGMVVDVGNSAQGQANQRRTAVGVGPNPDIIRERNIMMRRIDSNGGTNLFFDSWRPRFVSPEDEDLINGWRCGFFNTPDYVSSQGLAPAQFLARFASRDFVLLRGVEDNRPTIGSEVHTAAIAQDAEGCEPNRFARGATWADYMVRRFSEQGLIEMGRFRDHGLTESGGSFNFIPVPKTDHGALGMFTSQVGLAAMFGSISEIARYSVL